MAARPTGPSTTSTAAPRPSRLERTSAAPFGSGSSRIPATTNKRSALALRARWCTSAIVASSAACWSSIASTTPRSAGGLRQELSDRREHAMAIHGFVGRAGAGGCTVGEQPGQCGLCTVTERADELRGAARRAGRGPQRGARTPRGLPPPEPHRGACESRPLRPGRARLRSRRVLPIPSDPVTSSASAVRRSPRAAAHVGPWRPVLAHAPRRERAGAAARGPPGRA